MADSILRGFQQAAAWARSTRAKLLTVDDRDFLSCLREDRVATRRDLGLADRTQDRVRQRCRRNGWAECVGTDPGVHKSGWVLTAAGAQVMREAMEAVK